MTEVAARQAPQRGRNLVNTHTPFSRAPRAIETVPNTSKAALIVARSYAQHAANTCASDALTVLFMNALELRKTHARLAAHFLRTLELRAACMAAGIGYETGRTYLKKLFEVTGTSSQVELVVVLGWVGRGCSEDGDGFRGIKVSAMGAASITTPLPAAR